MMNLFSSFGELLQLGLYQIATACQRLLGLFVCWGCLLGLCVEVVYWGCQPANLKTWLSWNGKRDRLKSVEARQEKPEQRERALFQHLATPQQTIKIIDCICHQPARGRELPGRRARRQRRCSHGKAGCSLRCRRRARRRRARRRCCFRCRRSCFRRQERIRCRRRARRRCSSGARRRARRRLRLLPVQPQVPPKGPPPKGPPPMLHDRRLGDYAWTYQFRKQRRQGAADAGE
jgi:hypothetical protein